jgi:uncharacterized protein with GYD domain
MLYILLTRLNADGQQMMLDNPEMFNEVCERVHVPGTQLLARYAVLGQYDFVLMAEARDPESMARLSLELGARARVHVETLSAISIGLLSEPWDSNLIPEFSGVEAPLPNLPDDEP